MLRPVQCLCAPDTKGLLSHWYVIASLSIMQVCATPLYQASFMGNTTEVKEMLEGGADVNQQNSVSRIIVL